MVESVPKRAPVAITKLKFVSFQISTSVRMQMVAAITCVVIWRVHTSAPVTSTTACPLTRGLASEVSTTGDVQLLWSYSIYSCFVLHSLRILLETLLLYGCLPLIATACNYLFQSSRIRQLCAYCVPI